MEGGRCLCNIRIAGIVLLYKHSETGALWGYSAGEIGEASSRTGGKHQARRLKAIQPTGYALLVQDPAEGQKEICLGFVDVLDEDPAPRLD